MLAATVGLMPAACSDDAPPPSVAMTSGATTTGSSSSGAPPADSSGAPGEGSTTAGVEPWFEVGWGTNEFNAYEGTLPILVGPQGLSMFSVPLRGQGFYNPPDPAFDNPDMPMLEAWVDIDGFATDPRGHFNRVFDYPALFYPSLDNPGVLEGPAVWLVLPDGVEPEEVVGQPAHLFAELVDADGLRLVDEYDLVIGQAPRAPDG